jgi:terminase large subunit-like protein
MINLAPDLAFALDPVLFCRALGIEPDDWQAELLRTRPGRLLILASRQVGKSTIVAALVCWCIIYEPGSLIVMVSPSQRQSGEIFRTVKSFYGMLHNVPALIAESALRAEFANKSRVLALPGTPATIRGIAAADIIVLDEAARVDSEIIAAVRPMMATRPNAKIIALSTPAGKRGWFYEAWTKSTDWKKIEIKATDCPRISPDFLAEELRELGPQKFRQEYGLEFLDDDAAVFPLAVIQAAFGSKDVVPLWN